MGAVETQEGKALAFPLPSLAALPSVTCYMLLFYRGPELHEQGSWL